jgi:hypothetical protein
MRPRNFGVRVHDQQKATKGFTLYSPLWDTKTSLINMAGDVVHEWALPGNPGGYARLLPNGNLFYAAATDGGPPFKGGAKGGLIREVDWDNNVIMEYRDDWQHHDLRKLPNGNILYAGWEIMPEDTANRVKGGVPRSESPEGIVSDFVKEVTPNGAVVWEWHAHSDMEIEKYELHPLCPRRVFAWCNTVFPLDNGDVMISLRQINLVAIIDRETKKFKYERRDDGWGHQHDCQMLPNGNIMLFANGMNTLFPHPHSFVTEFNPVTNETVWEYRDDPCTYFYSHHISGAERLESGNTLICEGSFGRVFEVTPEKKIVWEFVNPKFNMTFMGETANWVFRAFRYSEDSPEIAGRVAL